MFTWMPRIDLALISGRASISDLPLQKEITGEMAEAGRSSMTEGKCSSCSRQFFHKTEQKDRLRRVKLGRGWGQKEVNAARVFRWVLLSIPSHKEFRSRRLPVHCALDSAAKCWPPFSSLPTEDDNDTSLKWVVTIYWPERSMSTTFLSCFFRSFSFLP